VAIPPSLIISRHCEERKRRGNPPPSLNQEIAALISFTRNDGVCCQETLISFARNDGVCYQETLISFARNDGVCCQETLISFTRNDGVCQREESLVSIIANSNNFLSLRGFHSTRHCEERSDVAIPPSLNQEIAALISFARNDGVCCQEALIYSLAMTVSVIIRPTPFYVDSY